MNNSSNFYNNLSETYDAETTRRQKYLDRVDAYILDSCNNINIENYLDIGSGDGRRSMKIAEKLKVKANIFLVDNSEKMSDKTIKNEKVSIYNISANDLNTNLKFNLITCLWNVLGHFPNKQNILDLFKKIDHLLSDDGCFIFDVNNRYNISQYGKESVAENIRLDYIKDENSGWFELNKGKDSTKVYIHSPFDIHDYLKGTDLFIKEVLYIDYNTGLLRPSFLGGQLVYKIQKNG
jgi:2-polyprenyl-3-methyl-5-hydroxy-6-metoxy-1,4-benzoquinol methylase